MKKVAGFFIASLMAISSSLTAGCTCAIPGSDWPSPINVDIGIGYREDNLQWSIAGLNNTPNILSELKWKDLQMVEVAIEGSYTSCRNYVVYAKYDYGYICQGHHTDSDYAGDDRTDLFSLSKSNAGKGYAYDIEGAVGYRATSTCGRLIAVPLIGYSFHTQHLHQFDGTQFVEFGYVDLEVPIEGLNSKYNTRWYGPWIGLDFAARVESCAYVFGGFQWHMASYRGSGKWNLRTDMGPFNDHAHCTGYVITAGGNWEIWDHWSLGLVSNYRRFHTRKGVDKTDFIFDDGTVIEVETKFNGAKWRSIDVLALVAWRF